jgi:hypothetical protein
MATYKTEKGFAVQTLTSDTAASIADTGSWASGGNLNTARSDLAGLGIETSAMAIAGYASPGTQSVVETYNGSSWTEITELNAARNSMGGFGATNTASIGCGGRTPTVAKTESWNGSAWTEVNDMNTARFSMNISGAGTQTSGLSSGGNGPAGQDTVEVWDGTNWTAAGAELNTTRSQGSASGQSSSSAAAVGGYGGSPDAPLATTELWNGSSWTEVADLNTARYSLVCTGNGTSLLVNGGEGSGTGILAITEAFDGTSWTEVADLSDTIKDHGGTGYSSTNTTALSFAGKSPSSSFKNTSEEWTTASSFTKTNLGQVYFNSTSNAFKVTQQLVSTGTWSSGGNMNNEKAGGAGAGVSLSAALSFGGSIPPYSATTELYNGTAWTEVNDLNLARGELGGSGTSTAAIAAGGANSGQKNETELWNGSSWTEVNNLNTNTDNLSQSAGTSTAAILAGGYTPGAPQYATKNESWDGTNWTEVNDLNTGRGLMPEIGTQTAAIVASGILGPPYSLPKSVEHWDGTSWTESTDMNVGGYRQFGSGIQTSALVYGGEAGNPPGGTGYPPAGVTANTEFWNGTSWTEINNLSTARYNQSSLPGAGGATTAIAAGGYTTTQVTATEEWTVPEANSTITVS